MAGFSFSWVAEALWSTPWFTYNGFRVPALADPGGLDTSEILRQSQY